MKTQFYIKEGVNTQSYLVLILNYVHFLPLPLRVCSQLTSSSEEGLRSVTETTGGAATGTCLSWSVGMVTTLPVMACGVCICSKWLAWDSTMGRPEKSTHGVNTLKLQISFKHHNQSYKVWLPPSVTLCSACMHLFHICPSIYNT